MWLKEKFSRKKPHRQHWRRWIASTMAETAWLLRWPRSPRRNCGVVTQRNLHDQVAKASVGRRGRRSRPRSHDLAVSHTLSTSSNRHYAPR